MPEMICFEDETYYFNSLKLAMHCLECFPPFDFSYVDWTYSRTRGGGGGADPSRYKKMIKKNCNFL